MNKNSIVETHAPFPFTFSLLDLLCSSLYFRSFLIWKSPVVSFSYFPFLIIHSPSYLTACDHFPIMPLKKMNLILKVSLLSLRVMKHWLVGPVGCQMVLMRPRSGVHPHMGLLVFLCLMASDCTSGFDQLFNKCIQVVKKECGYICTSSIMLLENSYKVSFSVYSIPCV